MTDTAPSPFAPLSLLILQSTPFCNIDCTYCYLPGRTNKGKLTPELLRTICEKVIADGHVGPKLRVSWHVGEPLAIGRERFTQLCDVLKDTLGKHTKLGISVQTNGMLIDDAWIKLFDDYDVQVGFSIDGPKRHHDRFRIDRQGKGTFDKTLEGLRKLKASGRRLSVICVLHDASLREPDEMFDFFESEGIDTVCFNIEESLNDRVSASYADGDLVDVSRRFFKRYFERVLAHGGRQWVRELNTIIRSCGNTAAGPLPQDQVGAAGAVLSIDWQGKCSTFSPELLTWAGAAGRYAFADLNTQSIADMQGNADFRRIAGEIQDGYRACAATCQYFRFCGGGVPAAKLAEHGRFDGTETMHCKVSVKAPVDAFLEILPQMGWEKMGEAGNPERDVREIELDTL